MLAIILSIIFPGLGQLYYGKNTRGVIMLLLGITPLYPIALIWSVIDVIRLNRQGAVPQYDLKEAFWAVFLIIVIVPALFFILAYGSLYLWSSYNEHYGKPKATRQEAAKIISALQKYKEEIGYYPNDLNDIIKGRPIRSRWRNDSWDEPYFYENKNDGQSFRLVSKGEDRQQGTEDDITFAQQNDP
jgi:TM2 domain-containing membrane protein YozV